MLATGHSVVGEEPEFSAQSYGQGLPCWRETESTGLSQLWESSANRLWPKPSAQNASEMLTRACVSRASEVIPGLHEQTQQLHPLERHRMSHVSPSHLRKPIKCVGRLPAKSGAVVEECRVWWIEASSNSFSTFLSRGETLCPGMVWWLQ